MQYILLLADSITITIVDGNINICIPGDSSLLLQHSLNSIINSVINSLFGSTITLAEASNWGSFNSPKSFIAGNVNHLIPFYQSFQDIVNNIGSRSNIHLNPSYTYIYTHFNVNIFLGPFVILAIVIKKQVIIPFSRYLETFVVKPLQKNINLLAKDLKAVFFNHVPGYLRDFVVRMAPKIPKEKLKNPEVVGLRSERRSATTSLRRGVDGLNTALNTLVTTLTINNLSLWRDANAPNGIAVRHNNNGTYNGNTVAAINTLIASINTHHFNIQNRHTALTDILIRMVQLNLHVPYGGDEDNLMSRAQYLMGQFSALLH